MEKHFNVTVYVIKNNQVLLIDHKKLEKWLPAGGHVETNESPEDAARREVKEETGLDIDFIQRDDLTTAWGIQHNIIKEGHEHFDIIYCAKPKDGDIALNKVETNGIGWFNLNEINQVDFRTFEKTKSWCILFLK